MENEVILYDDSNLLIKIDEEEVAFGDIEMNVCSKINEHSSLKLVLSIYSEDLFNNFDFVTERKISVEIRDEDKQLFSGYISNLKFYRIDGNKKVEIEALSFSMKMDVEKRFISYQDINVNYRNIVDSINERYTEETLSITGDTLGNEIQNELIIQYAESDWAYINRLASLKNLPIINIDTGIRFGFGDGEAVEIDIFRCRYNKINNFAEGYIKHNIELGDIYRNGEKIIINEEELSIIESRYFLENSVLIGNYTLVDSTKYKRNKIKNNNIAGRAIEAKVVEILNINEIAKLTVNFNINLAKREDETGIETQLGEELYQFPYVTPYSQSHTGYFCTPEVDDNVIVYFPDEKENNAYILGAVNSVANGRFSDRQNRNFIVPSTEEGEENKFEMTLSGDIIRTTTGNYIKIIANEEKTISENVVHRVEGTRELVVDGDVICTLNSNAQYTVASDYQVSSKNARVEASVNFDGKGGSATNISGGQVNIEGESSSNIKGGTVKIGGGSVSVGS